MTQTRPDPTQTDAPYRTLVEPPHIGGETYVQCRECEAELLTCLGGWDNLVHVEGCSYAEVA